MSSKDPGVVMWDGVERRKGADWVDVSINVLNILAWVIFLIALVIYHYAKPEIKYFVYEMVKEPVEVRTHWIEELKHWLFVTLYTCTFISALTLFVNRFRLKRRDDRQRYGMIMLVVVCVVFVGVISV